jgi:glycosyltransferase involved in cell wall biosynthesis
LLAPDIFVYNCLHDWSNDPRASLTTAEQDCFRNADVVFADSDVNIARARQTRNDVIALRKGVDYDLFAATRAEAVPDRNSPRCVYFGMVGANIDVNLLALVSHHFPLRIVGPVRCDLSGFSSQTEFIGPVSHQELPGYLRNTDVILLPYGNAPHVPGVVPAKIFECLATGKPVVYKGLQTLSEYGDLFYAAETRDDFMAAIRAVVHEPAYMREKRLACARENSWNVRFGQMEEVLENHLRSRNDTPARAYGGRA